MSSPPYDAPRSITPVPLIFHRYTDAVELLAEAMMAGEDTKEIQVSYELLDVVIRADL